MKNRNSDYCQYVQGRHSLVDAPAKLNINGDVMGHSQHYNNLTRRNFCLAQNMQTRRGSSNIASAGLKALRLYRHICRLIPFVLRIHNLLGKVSPIQAKRYIGNHFRKNSKITDPLKVDALVQVGYQDIYDAQMHFSNAGHLYKWVFSKDHRFRDMGYDRLKQQIGTRNNKEAPSGFLKSFYIGKKSHDL